MLKILRQIARTGIVTEPPPQAMPADDAALQRIQRELLDILGQALAIRQVDAGSCNGCELEIHALNNPYYNIEGLGIRFVASPRHADLLLVTGPVSRHMREALRRTYEATPEPRLVVAVGDCALQRRHLRRELCQLRPRRQRDAGRRRDRRLPARARRTAARHPARGATRAATHPRQSRPMPLHRFRPRLLDALKTYDGAQFGRDLGAGLTVGIVALPLAMAFAIASGVKPEAGIFTAIIAGFLISALGGSTVQIGGPAGAFIVIVYGIVERYGLANLLIATSLAGVLLFLLGLFKLGALVRYVPVPIIIGFTNGIAVLIALSQVKDLLGLRIEKMPSDFFAQIQVLWQHLRLDQPGGAGHRAGLPGAGGAVAQVLHHAAGADGPVGQAQAPECAPAGHDRRAGRAPRWSSRCCSCRWRPSARASAASRSRCRPSRCRS